MRSNCLPRTRGSASKVPYRPSKSPMGRTLVDPREPRDLDCMRPGAADNHDRSQAPAGSKSLWRKPGKTLDTPLGTLPYALALHRTPHAGRSPTWMTLSRSRGTAVTSSPREQSGDFTVTVITGTKAPEKISVEMIASAMGAQPVRRRTSSPSFLSCGPSTTSTLLDQGTDRLHAYRDSNPHLIARARVGE